MHKLCVSALRLICPWLATLLPKGALYNWSIVWSNPRFQHEKPCHLHAMKSVLCNNDRSHSEWQTQISKDCMWPFVYRMLYMGEICVAKWWIGCSLTFQRPCQITTGYCWHNEMHIWLFLTMKDMWRLHVSTSCYYTIFHSLFKVIY